MNPLPPATGEPYRVAMVCLGNICRSPMAEGLFRHLTAKMPGQYRAVSAGVGAVDGMPPSTHAVQALKELGIDISRQRSRSLSAELVRDADLILGMTHGHANAVVLMYPQAADKTFVLREFDDTLDDFEKDIADPIGGSYPVYLRCRDEIEQGIFSMLKHLQQQDGLARQAGIQRHRLQGDLASGDGGFQRLLSLVDGLAGLAPLLGRQASEFF